MFSRVKRVAMLLLVLTLLIPGAATGAWWRSEPPPLATINGQRYTGDDFRHWWQYWQEGGETHLSEALDKFVDFHLLVQQGLALGYDQRPGYQRKVEVFLKVRALGRLKYEEVDSRVKIEEAEIRKFFEQNHSPIWLVQILSFDTQEKAQVAYDSMLPFQGQVTGRLAFADLQGGEAESRADYYDEAPVTPDKLSDGDKKEWLEIIRKLPVNEVSAPYYYAGNQKYLLFRVAGTSLPDESEYAKRRQKISEDLNKAKRQRLTSELVDKLRKKHRVEVDEELLREIRLDGEHPEEFLDRKLMTMTDLTLTVGDFLRSTRQEMKLRAGLEPELLKSMVLSGIIAQLVIDRESLARGYEKIPPLAWMYEFYQQNHLGAEIAAVLADSITIDEEEVKKHYQKNIDAYSVPEKLTLILISGEEEIINKIWLGSLQGSDLQEIAQKYSLTAPLRTEERGKLPAAVVEALDQLEADGLSPIFPLDQGYGLVKLLKREPGRVHPLEQVRMKVVQRLKEEKLKTLKADYVKTLREKSEIEIDRSVWEDLSRELK